MTVLSHWGLALLAPLAFMAFWGAFLSPKAAYVLPVAVRDGLRQLVFAVAALAARQVWGQPFAAGLLVLSALTMLASRFI